MASQDELSVNDAGVAAHFYPEIAVAGFSHVDMSIAFYSQVAALLRPHHRVLDFGAGRGEPITDDPVQYRRELVRLKGRCAHVAGCDVDPVVKSNPHIDSAAVFDPKGTLPYPNQSFDIIVSRYVFEHIQDPTHWAAELLRVLKPGGWLCAVTPNKFGYVALFARLIPNKRHARYLRKVQPGRKAEDVFPTVYRLNSKSDLRKHFGSRGKLYMFRASSEPAYHFGNRIIFGTLKLLHKLLPDVCHTGLFIFFRKDGAAMADPGA